MPCYEEDWSMSEISIEEDSESDHSNVHFESMLTINEKPDLNIVMDLNELIEETFSSIELQSQKIDNILIDLQQQTK